MFIGKSVCVIGAIVIAGTCGKACMDRNAGVGNKLKLIGLAGLLGVIISSL